MKNVRYLLLSSRRNLTRISCLNHVKLYSTQSPIVIISKSKNIFENLALEDWLYKHSDLDNQSVLLMWRNTPAVVIGRHQNPWHECDVSSVLTQKVDLARRNSGGGTVYHDKGNLNCSFLTSRNLYKRSVNLELVVEAVKSRWDVDLTINYKNDIVLNGLYKVSGTAAKLCRDRAYHHFTLLINVNQHHLHQYLHSTMCGVKTKATESIPSHVMNLQDVEPGINYTDLVDAIADTYLQHQSFKQKQVIYPSETSYPGFNQILSDLKTFDWIFGKTPKFTINRSFVNQHSDFKNCRCDIIIDIQKGCIKDVNVSLNVMHQVSQELKNSFIDVPYSSKELFPLFSKFEVSCCGLDLWIVQCLKVSLNI